MRSQNRTKNVKRILHIGHPVADGLINRILQGFATRMNTRNFRTQEPHAKHIERLPFHIFNTHINFALETKHRRHSCRCHAVLSGTSLGNNPRFTHPVGEQNLPHGMIDFMRPRMGEVFALEINFRTTEFFCQPLGKIKRCGPPDILAQISIQFSPKLGVALCLPISRLQVFQQRHKRLGHILPTIRPKMPARIGQITRVYSHIVYPFKYPQQPDRKMPDTDRSHHHRAMPLPRGDAGCAGP